jgi:hypothetical protein
MKRLALVAFGKTNQDLADALDHAALQLRLGTPSENVTWENRSHVSFDVYKSSDGEFCEATNEDPE